MTILILITTCLLILCLFYYLKDDRGDAFTYLLLILIFFVVIGWGFFAGLHVNKTREVPAVISEIIKGRHSTTVVTYCDDCLENTDILIFRDNKSDTITNKTIFYWYEEYNLYNIKLSKTLKFK